MKLNGLRFVRFLRHFCVMRSISLALWVDEFEQHKPHFNYDK